MTELILHDPVLVRGILKIVVAGSDSNVYAFGALGTALADATAVDNAIPTSSTAFRIIESAAARAVFVDDISDNFQ